MQIILSGPSISDGRLSDGLAFAVTGPKLTRVAEAAQVQAEYPHAEVIDLRRFTVLPGLIDSHVHGGNGYDTMDGSYASVNGMSEYKTREGVTSFCPATVTASDEMTAAAVQSVREAMEKGVSGAKVIGVFLEGPYINPKNKGAHPLEFIRPVNLAEMQNLTESARTPDGIVSLAIAPELPGAEEAIKALADAGINLRMGHSSATLAEAVKGAEAGANVAIHTYNAMSPLNHREPGMVGAALSIGGLYAEIICDLVHVHPAAIQILAQAKGAEKVILITDCMAAGGLQDGGYTLGELPVQVKDGIARLADGTLAGSTATLMNCLKNMHETVGIPLPQAVSMATANPARALGLFDRVGSLDEGKQADIIAIDEHFNLRFVMVDGVVKLWRKDS